jgi:glyoxylase-like metal-dependent hydrolase (beta-lactamase superfamily II)
MKLMEHLYAYPWRGRGNNCNSYLVTGEKTVLIDPGHIHNEWGERCLDTLVRRLSEDGFYLEQVDLILCTHGHPDHVEAASVIKEKSGAQVALHREDEPIIAEIERYFGSAAGQAKAALKPNIYLQEGDLDLGEGAEQIRVIHTPGHSPGSVCFLLPRLKVLISGDTVFENSIGRSDLPGGDMATLGRSIDKLAALQDVELLLPGHMGFVSGAEDVRRNFERIKYFFF